MEQILVAVISGLCVAVPSIIATISTNKKNNDLVIYRINELDDRVSAHNKLIERMYKVESKVAIIEGDIKELKSAK